MMLDSNIIIDYLNGDKHVGSQIDSWRKSGRVLFISHISVIETLSLGTLSPAQIEHIKIFLDDFIVLSLDMHISLAAAKLRREHSLALADSIIVASAIVNNLPLATRDKKLRSLPGIAIAEL
ncbi:MAG TPA: PIN domain-containing protein [Candidatus Paceibacterota bacterium]